MPKPENQYQIIIVDDQHDVRRVLRGALETLGDLYQVIDTPSAEEAWLVLSRQPIDLLVLDVRLPGISGLDFLQRLRSKKPEIKVILITGVADPKIRQQASEAQADAFFLKPIDLVDFQNTVKKLLEPKTALGTPKTDELREEEPQDRALVEKLAELKGKISAEGALLLGRDGKVLSIVGPHPQWITEAGWIQSLVLSYRIGIHKLFSDRTASVESTLTIKGPELKLAFIPLNTDYVLLLWSDKGYGFLPDLAEETKKLTAEVAELLAATSISKKVQKSIEPEPAPFVLKQPDGKIEGTETALESIDLDKLFQEGKKARLGTKELNSFWETSASKASKSYERDKGSLTFDEAKKMGFTLEDDEEPPS